MKNLIFLWGYDLYTNSGVGWVLTGFAIAVMIVIILSFFQKDKSE